MSKIYQKMTLFGKSPAKSVLGGFMHKVILRLCYSASHPLSIKQAGFTLIELLVVVLIIGILAAIALPQYEIAVLKSRMSTALPLMRAIKDANEVYYMANGEYSDDISNLDVQFPPGEDIRVSSGRVAYGNGINIDNISGSEAGGDIIGGYSGAEGICMFRMFYDRSPYPGKITCGETSGVPNWYNIGSHPKCAQVCKSMGY